jgi:uncharacterized protein Usg
MNNEKIKILAQKTLEKYEGEKNVSDVIKKMKEDLDATLNTYLVQNHAIEEDFPIEFKNELGKWQINADGNIYVQPKKGTQYIECNITIKLTGKLCITNNIH